MAVSTCPMSRKCHIWCPGATSLRLKVPLYRIFTCSVRCALGKRRSANEFLPLCRCYSAADDVAKIFFQTQGLPRRPPTCGMNTCIWLLKAVLCCLLCHLQACTGHYLFIYKFIYYQDHYTVPTCSFLMWVMHFHSGCIVYADICAHENTPIKN